MIRMHENWFGIGGTLAVPMRICMGIPTKIFVKIEPRKKILD